MTANREESAPAGPSARRTIGFAAGAMIVAGAVVASAFGFNNGTAPTPSAAGEPVGALPSKGAPAGPAAAPPAAPDARQVTDPASAGDAPQAARSPEGQIGRAVSVKPPAQAKAPVAPVAPAPPAVDKPAPPPQAADQGPVQTLTEPVTDTVGGGTLSNVVAPVTSTVDDTLQPALSLIGGLLGR